MPELAAALVPEAPAPGGPAQRTVAPDVLRALAGGTAVPAAMLPIDPARPLPLIVEGGPREWAAAASPSTHMVLAALPVATVAVVRGAPSAPVRELLRRFDLRAAVVRDPGEAPDVEVAGPAATVARALDGWWRGFQRSPQACTVAAHLLRLEQRSLLAESLAYSTLQVGREHAAWLAGRSGGAPGRTLLHEVADRAGRRPGVASSMGRCAARPGGPRCVSHGRRICVLAGDGYHEVVLRRPGRHNAVDAAMREELCDVLDALAATPGAVALRGEGPSFCSGGDLDEFGTLEDPVHAHLVRASRSVAERLDRLAGRLVVAVHGACVGAGVELAAFGTQVIAALDTRFRLPEASFGLLPGAGGTVSLPARIGRQRLLDWIVTGRWVDATTAGACGLVDELVEPAGLVARLRELARDGRR